MTLFCLLTGLPARPDHFCQFLGLGSLAMIKKSSRIYYEYEGEQLFIKIVFGISKKHSRCSKYYFLQMS